jgi:hypothetical protein
VLRIYKRVLPVEETYQRLQGLMPQVGVTHVLELTALDSLGLPVCMAFGPLPAGSDLRALAAKALGSPADSKQASEGLEQVWDSLETFPRRKQEIFAGDGGRKRPDRLDAR